ncbi:MAG: RNA methyltransferase [Cyanobacteriota bacterium]|nr:RNA methyltransferase [Cyanobacteriota bacterium]
MTAEPITSLRNPLIKRLRDLHHAAGRQERQRLLLEGSHLLEEALRLGLAPDLLLATSSWLKRHGALLEALPAAVPWREVSAEVLAAAATTRHPDGVIATLPWTLPAPPPAPPTPAFALLLDHVQDPGNLGTLLRTALAAGVEQIWLGEGADPWQPKVLRASSGASLALGIGRFHAAELLDRVRQARSAGLTVVGTVARGGEPYWSHDWQSPTVLMLGNEGAGLSPDLLARADRLVSLPHSAAVESLNVAVAAGPLLLERERQRLGAGSPGIGAPRDVVSGGRGNERMRSTLQPDPR